MWANFISHCDEGAIFHNSRSELFHIRCKPNISLKAYDSKFFEILQMHFGHFGSVDRFEPAKRLKYSQSCGKIKKKGGESNENFLF